MGKFDLYKIPLKTMSIGTHNFEFQLDNIFFKNIDGIEFQKGNVKVSLTVIKTSLSHEFQFAMDGIIQISCDRCLDDMDLPISTQNKLYVKLGKDYSEESDDIVVIPEDEGVINIAWFLYEFIALEIPIKHVHAPGKCNKTMSSKLKKHVIYNKDENDDDFEENDGMAEDDSADDDAEVQTDPRWDELKKLIDNN